MNKLNFFKNKATGYYWNPSKNIIDLDLLRKIDYIVNLSGASIAKPWTSSYKRKIFNSRILTTNFLFNKINSIKSKIQLKKIVSASAIGIYDDSLTELYNVAQRQNIIYLNPHSLHPFSIDSFVKFSK